MRYFRIFQPLEYTSCKTFKITLGLYEVHTAASSSNIWSNLPLTITPRNTP